MTTRVGFGDEGEESGGDAPSWGAGAGSGWGDSTGSGWATGHGGGKEGEHTGSWGGNVGGMGSARPRPQRSQGMIPPTPSAPMTPSAPAATSGGQPGEVWHGTGVAGGSWGAPTMFNGMDISNAAYEDGGEVPEFDDPNADAATLDPMQIVKAALTYGRKKMGLPETFYPDLDTQSFDDGGMVDEEEPDTGEQGGMIPEQPQQGSPQGVTAGGNAPPVNPKALIQYMGGAGGIAPDVVSAMERQVDPAGAMDASQRFMAVLGKAPSPDVASGILQYGRARYNMLSAAAKASLSKGDFAGAAGYATQAFANVPTGYSIQFAPTKEGLVMSTKPHGRGTREPMQELPQGGQQSFDDGGEVDEESDTINSPSPEGGGDTPASLITPQQLVALFNYDQTVEAAASAPTPQAASPSEPPLPTPQQPQVPRKRPESRPAPKRDLNANPYKVGGLPPADPGQEGLPEASRSRASPLKGIIDTARGMFPGATPTPEQGVIPSTPTDTEQGANPDGTGGQNYAESAGEPAPTQETPNNPEKPYANGQWDNWWNDLAKRSQPKQKGVSIIRNGQSTLYPFNDDDNSAPSEHTQKMRDISKLTGELNLSPAAREKFLERASEIILTNKEGIARDNNQTRRAASDQSDQLKRDIATQKITHQDLRAEQNGMNRARIEAAKIANSQVNAARGREASVVRAQLMADPDYVRSDDFKQKVTTLAAGAKATPQAVYDGLIMELKLPEAGQQQAPASAAPYKRTGNEETRPITSGPHKGKSAYQNPDTGAWFVITGQ